MRADVPGTSHYVDYRGPDELTIGDIDAWNEPFEEIFAARTNADDGDDGMEVSADGLTMAPKPRASGTQITVDHLRRRRDILLGRVITGWSFPVDLPYTAEKRATLPAAAVPALVKAYDTLTEAIGELDGPKEKTAPTAPGGGSATTSPDESPSGPPALTPEPSATAAG